MLFSKLLIYKIHFYVVALFFKVFPHPFIRRKRTIETDLSGFDCVKTFIVPSTYMWQLLVHIEHNLAEKLFLFCYTKIRDRKLCSSSPP